jgi:thiamine-monophosphate kinase
MEMLTIQDVGEQGLLKRLQAFCPPEMVGDDAAVLTPLPERLLVVTTDVLVEHVHFSPLTTPPISVGWRAVAANLSDLAAMGALPLGITVGLGAPSTTSVDWVEDLYRGMVDCLQRYGTVIVGGDICRSPVISVAITAFGQVQPRGVIRRSTALPGDVILVTGGHGASRAGLELLLHPEMGCELAAIDRATLIRAHQYPQPRLDVVGKLPHPEALRLSSPRASGMNQSTREALISGMDSSDGLADAVLQICRASGVGARLDRSALPIHPALKTWKSAETAVQWTLYGGEDFELVLCLPLEMAQSLVGELGGAAAIVGAITPDPDVRLIDPTGVQPDEILSLDRGFQHF